MLDLFVTLAKPKHIKSNGYHVCTEITPWKSTYQGWGVCASLNRKSKKLNAKQSGFFLRNFHQLVSTSRRKNITFCLCFAKLSQTWTVLWLCVHIGVLVCGRSTLASALQLWNFLQLCRQGKMATICQLFTHTNTHTVEWRPQTCKHTTLLHWS